MNPATKVGPKKSAVNFMFSMQLKNDAKPIERQLSMLRKHEETYLIRFICAAFRRWAYFIARHATLAIIICILISIVCTIKIIKTPYKNDMTGFVPYGARSRDEYAIREEFTNKQGRGVLMMALIVAKDEGTVLKSEVLREAVKINDIITTNFTLFNHITGSLDNYNEYCSSLCAINEPLRQFYNAFEVQLELLASNMALNERISLGYPITTIYGRKMNIQMNFHGVVLSDDTTVNGTELAEAGNITLISNMVSAKMITLMYREENVGDWSDDEVTEYELSIVRYFQRVYKPEHVRVFVVTFSYVDYEITRAGLSMLPYLIVGFAIMSVCSTLSTLISAAYMQQINFHKIYLAIFACICPFMANATAIGILLSVGVRYGSILCITPFLVLAIGVDDAYLMIHAWQRVTSKCRNHPTKDDCEAYRLAEVLAETGPAILISAITNILADAVGTFTGSPEITLLCYGNMASIFMDFVFQLTFYSAIMCIAGRYEIMAESERLNTHSIEIDGEKSMDVSSCCAQTSREFHDSVKHSCAAFLYGYVKLVTNGIFASGVFCVWILFIAFSIVGITRIKIELKPEKLFPHDSPMIEADHLRARYQVPQYTMGQFYVNDPGNLSDPIRLQRLNQMVYELEHMNCSWGPQSSNYFIRDFLAFEKVSVEEEGDGDHIMRGTNGTRILFNEKDLRSFFDWPEYEIWRGFVQLNKSSGALNKFFFTTGYHGEGLKEWTERGALLNNWRRIIDKYRDEFNVSVYHDDAIFLDLIGNMPTDAWQSAVGTLLSMAFICFIFLYDKFTVAVVSVAILSIMTGIIGVVSWMGVDLEPIMMAAMLISIGFSVDIPAHVSYHYNSADAHFDRPITVEERLRICLASVALPALQASLSTNLCVLGLLFIPLYMAQVFVKMMVSCITLCVLHGLLVIPCVFSLIEIILRACQSPTSVVPSSADG
ncbi:Patched domain-containing protein 3 [Toxocara canis]|uniref:Patched domain-containing protein 3 n=1 Tax=Toxocara canis TaxID=6265 RepID=A0A0B2UHX2_TOXCA|nr:Patched domain-containing protein 3 [Toxocara canis]